VDCKSTIHRFESGRRLQHPLPTRSMTRRSRTALGLVLLLAAVAMAVSGYVFGNPLVIFQKAANVCLECIGVG
jgi:hypothetical protein